MRVRMYMYCYVYIVILDVSIHVYIYMYTHACIHTYAHWIMYVHLCVDTRHECADVWVHIVVVIGAYVWVHEVWGDVCTRVWAYVCV